MRILTIILLILLNCQSFSKANNLNEFQIESMSVGESLLNFFKKSEIKLLIKSTNSFVYKDNKYVSITTHADYDIYSASSEDDPYADTVENYDYVGVVIKPSDNKFIIFEINAYLNFPDDYEGCKNKKKEIVSDISSMFKNIKIESETSPHHYDKSGESISFDTWFYLDDGYASVHCEKWSKKFQEKYGWDNKLKVRLTSEKFMNFLANVQYK